MLAACLESLDGQTIPGGERHDHDVVVVDNGSTDGTGAWLGRWAAASPRRRLVVREPVPGLSRARNAGIAAAGGDVVCFIDDDALAPPGWVAAHTDAYRRSPATAAVGGPVVLSWPDGRPGWLAPRLEHWFSALDHGDRAGPFPPPHGPYGTNMSVRRDVLAEVGGFAPRLGRRGRSLLSSEEADLWRRVWAGGHDIAYEPAALVLHRVTGARTTRRWVLRRGWAQGRSNARLRTLGAPLDGAAVRRACRSELALAVAGWRDLVRGAARGDQPAVIDEVARRSGHVSAVAEHAWMWARPAAAGPA
jgi:glycosyltransferase involved in cell wall biosynthesis